MSDQGTITVRYHDVLQYTCAILGSVRTVDRKMCSDKQGDTGAHQDRLMNGYVYRYDLFFGLTCILKGDGFRKMLKRA